MMEIVKSQSSMEFMAFIIILSILFLIISSNSSSLTIELSNSRRYAEGKKLTDSIALEINTAINAGDGYTRRFLISDDIFGATNFSIIISNYTTLVDWHSGFASSPAITDNIQGNFSKGWNTIKNSGGTIYVS